MRVINRSRTLGVLAILLLGACGGAEQSLTLAAPETLSVPPGGSTTVSIAVTRTEATRGEFALAVSGLPQGVSATFAPATIAEDTREATLTLAATREAARGAAVVTVTATRTGSEPLVASARFALDVRGITVRGRVVAAHFEEPVPGVTVRVGEAFTLSDANGEFSVTDVTLPYDLTVGSRDIPVVEYFPGLTTEAPVVRSFYGAQTLSPRSANLQVVLSAPVPAGQVVSICAVGTEAFAQGCTQVPAGALSGSVSVQWAGGPEPRPVKVTAYAYTLQDETVSAVVAAAESAIVMVEDEADPVVHLTLGAAPRTSLTTLEFSLPEWAEVGGPLTVSPVGPDTFVFLGGGIGSTLIFPEAPHVAMAMGTAIGMAWRPASSPSTAPLTFASVPALVPFHDEILTPETEFILSAHAPGEMTAIGFEIGGAIVFVHTMEDRFRLPDLSGFMQDTELTFRGAPMLVRGGNLESMDDAVTGPGVLESFFGLMSGQFFKGVTTEGSVTFSLML